MVKASILLIWFQRVVIFSVFSSIIHVEKKTILFFLANYCFAKQEKPEGLMLLCEVALGKTHDCYHATKLSATTLPTGTNSTKGCGQTIPDPNKNYHADDGVLIPIGNGVNANIAYSSLLYNEYIVYDTDQIRMKYLLRIEFEFKD